jgi:hypothetical protein
MAQISITAIDATKLAKLLAATNSGKNLKVWVLTPDELAFGIEPPLRMGTIDLISEQVRANGHSEPDAPAEPPRPAPARLSRRTGQYLLEIKGRTIECSSLKEMLAEGLRALEVHKKGTLDKLAAAKSRTRRIVSRDPSKLFDKTHLEEKHAEPLMEGWWYGTNNSALETNRWLRQACALAGLTWDRDFSTSA